MTPRRAMCPANLLHTPDTVALMGDGRATLADFERKFAEIRSESERAIGQLDAAAIRRSPNGDVNSVAIIMKHVGGNLRSRFTDFLASDGEKPWRDRDTEFADDFPPGEQGRAPRLPPGPDHAHCAHAGGAVVLEDDLDPARRHIGASRGDGV